MSEKVRQWIEESAEWRQTLERGLEKPNSGDVWIPYAQVARAFPANEPNPHFFDHPLLEWEDLHRWAREHGWNVEPVTEGVSEKLVNLPPVRFVKA